MNDISPFSADHGGLRMLIADDDRDAAESLVMLMQLEGHTVYIAHDGAQALVMALRLLPQVSILDIGMPTMDGHTVARCIREALPGTRMLIVALTGREQPADRRRSIAAGFDHHFVKPVALSELKKCLAHWHGASGAGLPARQ